MAEAVRSRPKTKKKTKVKKPKDVSEDLKTVPPVPSASVTPAEKQRENEQRRSLVEADLDSNRYSYTSDQDGQDGSAVSDKDSDINKSVELNSDLEIEQTVLEPVIGTPNDSENAKDKGSENWDKSESDNLFISAYSDAAGIATPDECEQPEEFTVAVENVHVRPRASTTDVDADKESVANTPVTTSASAEALGIANVDLIPSLEKSDIVSSPEDQASGASSVVCLDEGGGGTMGGEASHEVQESRVETAHQPDIVTGNQSVREPVESAAIDVAGTAAEPDTKDSLDGFTLLDPSPMDAAPATEDKRPSTFESPLQTILTTTEPDAPSIYPQLFQTGRIKALTAEQLKSLYYNPILEGLDRVTNDFLENIYDSKHEFYEIVLNYYRARNHLVSAEQDVEALRTDCVRYSDLVWITQDKSVKVQGKCADGYNVYTNHTFEITAYDEQAQNDLSRILKTLRSFVHEELSLYAYSAQLSKLQVESYLHELYMSCPALLDIPENSPVTADEPCQRSAQLSEQVYRLKTCIQILFQFQRKPSRDIVFVKDAQMWLRRLVASLLRVATTEDHVFLLNHILRCPAGIQSWAVDFIQIPELPCAVGQASWGHPLLDHTVAMLATLMRPAMGREDLLYQFRAAMTPMSLYTAENPWILVDSDGEEDEDDLNSWQFLMENDLVALLDQLPLVPLFKHVLYVNPDCSPGDSYTVGHTTESGMLKLFAFASCIIRILGCGLENFCQGRYRQLNKRLARLVKEVLDYVSEHWENMKSVCVDLPDEIHKRLQLEFDQTFCRAMVTIIAAPRLGSWQFLAQLPYSRVSEEMMWQLLWRMHHGCKEGMTSDVHQMPHILCKELLRDPECRVQFEEKLVKMPTSEAIYLLTTFANMACSRPQHSQDLVEAITGEIYELAFLSCHTREFCSKTGRELLSMIANVHPFTIGIMLRSIRNTIAQVGMPAMRRSDEDMANYLEVSLYLFRELPVSLWHPTEEELSILTNWLLERDIGSPENQLARLVLEKLNWGPNPEGTELFLNIEVQRHMAVVLVEAYIKHLANKNVASYLTESMKQMASVVRNQLTWEQLLSNWAWEMALRLSLHATTHPHPLPPTANTGITHPSIPDINESPKFYPIIRALQNSNPLASYLALVMSKYGHGTAEFCSEGLLLLGRLVEQHHYVSAVRVLSYIMPLFYTCPLYLAQNNRFIAFMQSLMYSDQVRKSMSILSWDFPGPITKLVSAMIQAAIQKAGDENAGGINGATVISFWLDKLAKVPRWQQDRNILYVVDNLVKAGMRTAEGTEVVGTFFREEYQSLLSGPREQSMISSLVSWISTGNTLPSLQESQACPEFPWFAYQVLLAETEYEAESRLWPTMQQELFESPDLPVDQALKCIVQKSQTALGLNETLVVSRLCIYRWAYQALEMTLDHPLLPLTWQRFFLIYLGRLSSQPGLPARGSVSEKFFESMSNVSLMKRMKKRLGEAADYHHKMAVDCNKPETPDNSDDEGAVLPSLPEHSAKAIFHEELVKLYQTLLFWLDEPRLHDPNLYLPALPPQYMPDRLNTIFQSQTEPWIEFVCIPDLEEELNSLAAEWLHHCRQGAHDTITPTSTQPKLSPTARLLAKLRSEPVRKAPPPLITPRAPVEEVNHGILHDKKVLLYALRGDVQSLIDYAKLFSMRVSKHVAIDCTFLELLPNLYKNDINEVVLSIPCQSSFNPTHRCKGAAAVTIRFEEKTKSEIVGRKSDENRAEYKQLMIESLLPPPQTVCSAAVHVENVITALIRQSKSTPSNSVKASLLTVGTAMFYYLSSYISEDTKYYPPTRQFFSSCIEVLGQEFIHNNPTQSQPLLQCILKSPSLVGLLAPNFSPNATPELFVNMYEDMINVPTNQGVDVAFTLLTKFDVKHWLETVKPPLSERSALVEVIGNAFAVCGTDPDSKFRLVFEVYRSHLRYLLLHCFPDHYGDVLKLILKHSASGVLSVDVWTDFLKVLGCAPKKEPVKEVKVTGATEADPKVTELKDDAMTTSTMSTTSTVSDCEVLVQPPISHIRETMDWLSQYFFRLRVCRPDSASFGLYPHWQPYVSSIVSFFRYLTRHLVVHTAKLVTTEDMPAQPSLEDLWKLVMEMFAPWIQPLDNQGQILAPWIQSDIDIAANMMAVFRDTVKDIQDQFEGLTSHPHRSILGLLWPYYATVLSKRGNPECVLSIYHSELVSLPWETFFPNTDAFELMKQVQSSQSRSCFYFLAQVFCQMNWSAVLEQCGSHEDLALAHRSIFDLLVKMAKERDIIETTELPRLLTIAEGFSWHFLDSASYDKTAHWFMDNCDARCVLAERTARNAQALGLMKSASGFIWKLDVLLHVETPVKRCTYVRCLVQLLCRCSHLIDVDPGDFATFINNLLTEIETVVGTVPEPDLLQHEALSLCGEALHVLNNAKPTSTATETIMRTMLEWIEDSPTSLLLQPLVTSAGRTLASVNHMALLVEALVQAHFCTEREDLGEIEGWGWVLSAVQVPELTQDDFLEACLQQNSFLTLFTFTLQRLPLSRSLDDEVPHLKRLVDWTVRAKPRRENEAKLFLLWAKVIELMLRQLHFGGDIKIIMRALNDFVPALFALAEDKASAGFLGSLGLGRRSQVSPRFRLIARCLATFLLAQVPTGSTLRTEPHSPGAPGVPSPQGQGPSSYTLQALMQLEALKQNKHYASMSGFITFAIEFAHEAKHSIRDSPELILHLVRELFPEKRYLGILHSTRSPTS